MKKIMILGAGIYQVPLIKQAKKMGLYTYVASIPGNYPGFDIADQVLYINTTDKESILNTCREENVDGIIVCGTDVAVPTQGYVCDQLGLKGPSYSAAVLAQNKAEMKKAFIQNKVRTADVVYVPIENENPIDECTGIGFPVIFKSIDSSGSRGITKVASPDDIHYAYEQVKKNTQSDTYIIEKYLSGDEFGAQAFIYDGEIQFILPHGDYVFQGDTGVPIGHYAPFDISDEIIEDAKTQLDAAVSALGLDNCAVNADFILCDGKTYVLEIGARAGATCLVEMTGLYYGFNYYEKIIQASIGIKPDFKTSVSTYQPNAEMLFISDKTGVIEQININNIKNKKIVDLSFDYSIGDEVRQFQKGPDRIGQIIAIGDSVSEAKSIIDDAMNNIEIIVK